MGINRFTFKGMDSYRDFELIITETPPFVFAERDITFTPISGRSGDLIFSNNRFKNVQKEYKVAALADKTPLPELTRKIAAWLESDTNYWALNDTYDPDYFQYACYSGKISFADKLLKLGSATLRFECKPFKYSFAGQQTVTLTRSGSTITNPESFEALPYIKISGTGTIKLTVNGKPFTFTGVSGYVEVDSEMMNCYKGDILKNDTMTSDGFPVLKPGNNTISWTGVVTKVEIIPRWCCL